MSFRSLTYSVLRFQSSVFFFFFNDTATTEIYTLSLHDALPISHAARWRGAHHGLPAPGRLSADRLHRPGHGKLPGGVARIGLACLGAHGPEHRADRAGLGQPLSAAAARTRGAHPARREIGRAHV